MNSIQIAALFTSILIFSRKPLANNQTIAVESIVIIKVDGNDKVNKSLIEVKYFSKKN